MLSTHLLNGAPNWLDLGTPDIEGAESFYGTLFGWRLESAGPEREGFGVFRLDDRTVAGTMTTPSGDWPPAWTIHFRTPDADATARAVRVGGGTVRVEPVDVFDFGRMAVFTDPAGAGFAVWQPGTYQGLDVLNEPGTLCWTELHTPDVPAAMAFYGSLLGIESASVPLPGGAGAYLLLTPAGRSDASFGGAVPHAPDAHWLPYFEVPDTDATATRTEQLGGTVPFPPANLTGIGRIAQLTDPYGARFAVITSAAPTEG
ncbi:VOC family protein [Streptomyces sp. NPDC006368]|uniref:VOC family protein n=1 Tax=Streptomyces sp. NPDC006368 TaxID=3156760 RepID=UPI0033B2CA68